MPFTAAHPALVLPFVKLRSRLLSTTGLVTGSIAPDFEYFIKLVVSSELSHTPAGIMLFNLPAALILATVFHVGVRDALITYMPAFLQRRAQNVSRLDWLKYLGKNWHIFALSAVLGAGTHIFWDSFTHFGGYFVQKWPVLARSVTLWGAQIPICRLIQHLSTGIGGILLGLFICGRKAGPVRRTASPRQKAFFWFSIALLAAGFVLFSLGSSLSYAYTRLVLINYLSGLILATVLVSLSVRRLKL